MAFFNGYKLKNQRAELALADLDVKPLETSQQSEKKESPISSETTPVPDETASIPRETTEQSGGLADRLFDKTVNTLKDVVDGLTNQLTAKDDQITAQGKQIKDLTDTLKLKETREFQMQTALQTANQKIQLLLTGEGEVVSGETTPVPDETESEIVENAPAGAVKVEVEQHEEPEDSFSEHRQPPKNHAGEDLPSEGGGVPIFRV